MVEFAITGSLALVALALLIQVGLRANYQQEIDQQTFRRAQRIAQNEGDEESQAIVLTHFRDRQVPNPSLGFVLTPRMSTQSNATVTWGEWLTFLAEDRDSQPRIEILVNDTQQTFRSEDIRKASSADESVDCGSYYFDCIEGCDDGDDACRDACRDAEESQCVDVPFVKKIEKSLTGTSSLTQGGVSGTIGTAFNVDTTDTTTLTLNTRDGDQQVSSQVTFNDGRSW